MEQAQWVAILSMVSILSGMWLGWSARNRSLMQDYKTEGGAFATLQVNIEYIKKGIDELKSVQQELCRRQEDYDKRLVKVEQAVKSAHKRIERLDHIVVGKDND